MCGICGVVRVGGGGPQVVESGVLDAMTDAMAHRGPDDRGTVMLPGMAFGARRLSIVDVAGGHQPFASEDERVWGMQNGELYNHAQIRSELEQDGHRFRSRCDTEILPHLYERDGAAFVERLRGKFALAVWDASERRAVLARDRLGVKPLYWAQVDDLVVFASELKSLLASGLAPVELDYEAIDTYLTFGFVPAPHTPLAGINKLLPGHRLIIDPSGVRSERYWAYPTPADPPDRRSEDELAEELLERLREAVRLRLMSDVPLGAMLSGGLDSSLIVALMAEQMSEPVKTFSVGFREDPDSNELADARLVASHYGCDHHELELSFTHDTVDLTTLVWHLDEPVADLSALGFLALSQLARQHVTVALSGQGADELFAGYQRYRNAAVAARFRRLPRPLRNAAVVGMRHGTAKTKRVAEIVSAETPVSRMLALHGRGAEIRTRLRRGPLLELDGGAAARAVARLANGVDDTDPLATTLYLDAQLALPDDMLHYFDRTSMAHSLEVRVPFLDHELVEWAARIPTTLKVRHLTTKHILKHAARATTLPEAIIDKRKIGFFSGAVAGWIGRHGATALDAHLYDRRPHVGEFVDIEAMRGFAGGTTEERNTALMVLVLEIWLENVLDRGGRPSRLVASGVA